MIEWLRPGKSKVPTLRVGSAELPVIIRRLPQARRMTMRLSPEGDEVRISIPKWGTTSEAMVFARTKADWLLGQQASRPARVAVMPGSTVMFRGDAKCIDHVTAGPRKPCVDRETIRVGGPLDGLETRLRRWLEKEAFSAIAADLAFYCARADQAVPRLGLSNARRRWGSCATRGAIRINWRLIMAPDFVRRSVVAHEVTHLIHFDHSPRFHAKLDEIYEEDIAQANRWLKQHGRMLYATFE